MIMDDVTLNNFLRHIGNLKIIKISKTDEFYKKIVKKDQALYYMMAETSIKDAIKSNKSEDYFGFDVKGDDVDKNFLKPTIISEKDNKDSRFNEIFKSVINIIQGSKYRQQEEKYFLTFIDSEDGLFDILHNDFKTQIFKSSGEYEDNISLRSKENILETVHKHLKIGKSITTLFAQYLVRLEAHMLLENKDSWFVVKDNSELKNCFNLDPNVDKIPNKNAFVEIMADDYEVIQKFLTRLNELKENDFNIDNIETETKKQK